MELTALDGFQIVINDSRDIHKLGFTVGVGAAQKESGMTKSTRNVGKPLPALQEDEPDRFARECPNARHRSQARPDQPYASR